MKGCITSLAWSKGCIGKTLGNYLWLMPALILIAVFLAAPTLQTIRLSLHQKVEMSERTVLDSLLTALSAATGRDVRSNDRIRQVPDWERAVARLLAEFPYRLKLELEEVHEGMTVRDTAQRLTAGLHRARREHGDTQRFAGLANYRRMASDPVMVIALRNNLLWLAVFTLGTVLLGLLMAVLADQVSWSGFAKTIIFLPMAISGVAAGVIWNFMYLKDIRTGTVNAVIHLLAKLHLIQGFEGIAFLGRPDLVNGALITAGVWMQAGFAMVIFGAALKGIPVALLEVARLEGAEKWQIFKRIQLPLIRPTVVLVLTQMIIWVLKVFDIIYTLTKGGPFHSSEVIANRMYMTAFNENNFQYAAAMAVVLLLAVTPVLVMNIRNLSYEERVRD